MYGARDHLLARPRAAPTRPCAVAKGLAAEHPDWVMLYQYGNPANAAGALRRHRPGDPRRPADDHALRRRASARRARSWASAASCASRSPASQIIAAEPRYGELVYGLRNIDEGFVPELYDASRADLPLLRRPARTPSTAPASCWSSEGIFAGISTGAILHAALGIAAKEVAAGEPRRHRASSSCDGGWKYLSTGAYAGTLDEARPRSRASSGPDPRAFHDRSTWPCPSCSVQIAPIMQGAARHAAWTARQPGPQRGAVPASPAARVRRATWAAASQGAP